MNDRSGKRGDKESHEKPGHELSSLASTTKSASQNSIPGILVFSHRRHLGHMNRRALELTGNLDQTETGPATMTLTGWVSELRVQIQETLDYRRNANIWELFELKRDMVEAGRKILLRGFGLADRDSHEGSRIVIVLEEGLLGQTTVQVCTPESPLPIVKETTL